MAKRLSEMEWDSITIEPARNEYTGEQEWSVYGHGEYEESSVLAGQYRRAFLDGFHLLEDAEAAYPTAHVAGRITCVRAPSMALCPPDWFDPADAGERWDEDY